MSTESVRKYFKERGLEDPVFILKESAATVEQAAKSLGVNASLIAKTLSFKVKEQSILIITKGDAKIDNKKYKKYFGVKAKMLDHQEVEEITGHPVGGVCPFGLKTLLDVFIDSSVSGLDYIYPAAGSHFIALKISPDQLVHLTNARWIDVCEEESVGE